MARSWWKKMVNRKSRPKPQDRLRSCFRRLILEELEDRVAPAIFAYSVPGDPTPHNLTLLQSGMDLRIVETGNLGNVLAFQALAGTDSVEVSGANSISDTLTIDYAAGFFAQPVSFQGGTGGSDQLVVQGTGTSTADYSPNAATNGSGLVKVTSGVQMSNITFSGLEPVTVSHMASLALKTPNSNDVLTVDSPAAGQNRISGTSGDVAFESVTFFAIPSVTVDAATNDAASANDSVTISSAGLVASGLQHFTVSTGSGADTLTVNTPSFGLPVAGGAFTFDGGAATDTIAASADVSYTLTNTSLASSGGGSIALTNMASEAASLMGGSSPNTFTITGWTGTGAVHGGGGLDSLVGPAGDRTWNVTGSNSGNIGGAGVLDFSGVENLRGAADNRDTFVFEAAGTVDGILDGGPGGFDALVLASGAFASVVFTAAGLNSGTIARDGNLITYAGLEPMTDMTGGAKVFNASGAADTIIVRDVAGSNNFEIDINTAEKVTFTNASAITSLTINALGGGDTITLNALDPNFNAALTINGDDDNDEVVFQAKTGSGVYTFSGGLGATDKVTATRTSGNFTLTDAQLTAAGTVLMLNTVEHAALTGGSDATTFTVSSFAGKSATLSGASGNDVYKLGDSFGSVTLLSPDAGTDTLDFTTHSGTLTVSADKTSFTSSDLSTLTQSSELAEDIDVPFAVGGVTAAQVIGGLNSGLDQISSYVATVKAGLHQLFNVLPLLDPGAANSLGDVLSLVTRFQEFVNDAKASIPSASTTLAQVVSALDVNAGPFTGIQFSTDYRRGAALGATPAGRLEVFIDIQLPTLALTKMIPLKLPDAAQNLGLSIEPQPVLNINGAVSGSLSVGRSAARTRHSWFPTPRRSPSSSTCRFRRVRTSAASR